MNQLNLFPLDDFAAEKKSEVTETESDVSEVEVNDGRYGRCEAVTHGYRCLLHAFPRGSTLCPPHAHSANIHDPKCPALQFCPWRFAGGISHREMMKIVDEDEWKEICALADGVEFVPYPEYETSDAEDEELVRKLTWLHNS